MLGDGCTCDLGWVLPTALPDMGARHPSLQGTSRAACSQAPEGHPAQEFTFSSRGQMGHLLWPGLGTLILGKERSSGLLAQPSSRGHGVCDGARAAGPWRE